jgi:5,8-dihydroxy-2-naphthoate synthase
VTLRLGISTCPNDTFAFHAILNKRIDLRGLDLDIVLLDVQELNQMLAKEELDFSKASFHAALCLAETYGVIRSGSALGSGVGPLLLSAKDGAIPEAESEVLCPGAWTTATLLLRCFYPSVTSIEQRLFSDIMPALVSGEADFGVVIHEGRFTYAEQGLHLVRDLGEAWEEKTNLPLPLGGILARRCLDSELHTRFHGVLQDSIRYAREHKQEALQTIRQYAQELDESVIWPYIDLYVNDYTSDLGEEGIHALKALERLASKAGVLEENSPALEILG